MIAIVDYGVGNLFSLHSSLAYLGLEAIITDEPDEICCCDKMILPGVGAYGDAMQKLQDSGLDRVIKAEAAKNKPLLGICLGMQLLFNSSTEFGEHEGLGLVPGRITSLADDMCKLGLDLKIPHMGWNTLLIQKPSCALLENTKESSSYYYVHSYYAVDCENCIVAYSEYGVQVPGIVQNRNVFGTQFHPEKSGACGLDILRAFGEMSAI